jgi:hypothetical protein
MQKTSVIQAPPQGVLDSPSMETDVEHFTRDLSWYFNYKVLLKVVSALYNGAPMIRMRNRDQV